MKSYEGYLKQKFGNEYILLAGGQHLELSNFKTASSNWLPISIYNDVNFNTFIDSTADLHNLASEELNLFRFYSENPLTYNLPCNDSLALIFSIDNSKDWIRALHFDIRTSDIYTINKTLGTWSNWSKIITSDNISLYIGSWHLSSDWDGTYFWLTGKYGGSTLPCAVSYASSCGGGGQALFSAGNIWVNPARLQLLRYDTTTYSDRCCVGVTNGNLHLDSYHGYDIYFNHYSQGNVHFGYYTSSYYISSGGVSYLASYYTTSDRKYKKDIRNIPQSSLDTLWRHSDNIIKTFKWKHTGKDSYGFIAQELDNIIPEAVSTKDDGTKTVSYDVAYAKIIASLIYKIKKLEREITEIKNGKVSN